MTIREKGCPDLGAPVTRSFDAAAKALTFTYEQQDLDRSTTLRFETGVDEVADDGELLSFPVRISARGEHVIGLVVVPHANGTLQPAPSGDLENPSELQRLTRRLVAGMTELEVDDSGVAQTWATAVSDLAALPLGIPEGPAAPIAGLPLHQSLFGRDVLTTGWQALLATGRALDLGVGPTGYVSCHRSSSGTGRAGRVERGGGQTVSR